MDKLDLSVMEIVKLKYDRHEVVLSNLVAQSILIIAEYVSQYDQLLCGVSRYIVQLDYEFFEDDKYIYDAGCRITTRI